MKYTEYYKSLNELLSTEQNLILKDFYIFVRNVLLDLKNQAESYYINISNWEEKYKNGRIAKFFFKEYRPINGVHQESFDSDYILFIPVKAKFRQTFPHVMHEIAGFPIVITFEPDTNSPMSIFMDKDKKYVTGLRINFKFLISDKDFSNALQHEIQHIADAEGASPENESNLSLLNYYLNNGEIQAYAKQLAYIYHKMFPQDTRIDYKKFKKSLNERSPNYFSLILYTVYLKNYKYARSFFNDVKFDQSLVDRMRAAHHDFMREMTRSLNYFTKIDVVPMKESNVKYTEYYTYLI